MPNFIGFSTIGKDKKFTLADIELVKRDLLNAFLIRAGTLPGRPEVGTRIWNYLLDPNDTITSSKIESEVRRIIALDKRIDLHEVVITNAVNTIRVHIACSIQPSRSTEEFFINFIQDAQTAPIT